MAQNVKKVASKNLKKPKVAENSKSCQNSKKLPKISKVAEKLPSNLWLSLSVSSNDKNTLSLTNELFIKVSASRHSRLELFPSWKSSGVDKTWGRPWPRPW